MKTDGREMWGWGASLYLVSVITLDPVGDMLAAPNLRIVQRLPRSQRTPPKPVGVSPLRVVFNRGGLAPYQQLTFIVRMASTLYIEIDRNRDCRM